MWPRVWARPAPATYGVQELLVHASAAIFIASHARMSTHVPCSSKTLIGAEHFSLALTCEIGTPILLNAHKVGAIDIYITIFVASGCLGVHLLLFQVLCWVGLALRGTPSALRLKLAMYYLLESSITGELLAGHRV